MYQSLQPDEPRKKRKWTRKPKPPRDYPTNVLATGLATGMTLNEIQTKLGWDDDTLNGSVEGFKQLRSAEIVDPRTAWSRYQTTVFEQIESLRKVKDTWENAEADTITQTVQETREGKHLTVTRRTTARGGVTASDYTRACMVIATLSREYVETGMALGVFPSAMTGPKTVTVYQTLVNAVRAGDWDKVDAIAKGKSVPAVAPQVLTQPVEPTDPEPTNPA